MEKYLNKTVRISNIPGVLYSIVGILTKIKGNVLYIGSGMRVEIDEQTVIEIIENEE